MVRRGPERLGGLSSIGYRRCGWLVRLIISIACVLLTTSVSHASDSSTSSTPDACNIGDTVPDCTPTVWGSVWISGVVTDPLAEPVVSATVSGGKQPVLTDSRGFYATEVYYRTDNPAVTLRAEKAGFDPVSKTVNAINAAVDGVDFQLFYSLSPSVSPRYFNNSPQKTLSFDVVTGVGPTVGKVWVQLPGGTSLDANHLYDESDGRSRWQAQWLVPASTADGHYGYKACGVTSLSSGNCDSISSGTLLTKVPGGIYTLDGTPPVIAAIGPRPNHNTINTRPTVAASVSDATSGVSYGATKIYLDGAQVAAGTSSYTPPSALPSGLHYVTVTAADLAGNTASVSWEFNVSTFSFGSSTGAIHEQTVDVNPDADLVSPPTTVTFNNVQFTLNGYPITLGPSPYTGYGVFSRSLPLGGVNVIFTNESGISSDPVHAGLSYLTFSQKGAQLLPESASTSAQLEAQTLSIPSVTVQVPTGYNTPGSRATIQMVNQPANGVQINGEDPNPYPLPSGPTAVTAALSANIQIQEDAYGSVSVAPGFNYQGSALAALPGLGPTPAFIGLPLSIPDDGPTHTFGTAPVVECATDTADNEDGCVLGRMAVAHSTPWLDLGSGSVRIYANHWTYRKSNVPHYIDWHQTSAYVYTGGCLENFTNVSQVTSLEGWLANRVVIPTASASPTGYFETAISWLSEGSNKIKTSESFDSHDLSNFADQKGSDWGRATWSVSTGDAAFGTYEKMASSVEFLPPEGTTAPYTFTLTQSHTAQFWLQGCGVADE